jgi:hypothetical protein
MVTRRPQAHEEAWERDFRTPKERQGCIAADAGREVISDMSFKQQPLIADGLIALALLMGVSLLLLIFSSARLP